MDFPIRKLVVITHVPATPADSTNSKDIVRFRRTAKRKAQCNDSEVDVPQRTVLSRGKAKAKPKVKGSDSNVTVPRRTLRSRKKADPNGQGSDSEITIIRRTRLRRQAQPNDSDVDVPQRTLRSTGKAKAKPEVKGSDSNDTVPRRTVHSRKRANPNGQGSDSEITNVRHTRLRKHDQSDYSEADVPHCTLRSTGKTIAKPKVEGSDSNVTVPRRTLRSRKKADPNGQGSDSEITIIRRTRLRRQAQPNGSEVDVPQCTLRSGGKAKAKPKVKGRDSNDIVPQQTLHSRKRANPNGQGSDSEITIIRHTRLRRQAQCNDSEVDVPQCTLRSTGKAKAKPKIKGSSDTIPRRTLHSRKKTNPNGQGNDSEITVIQRTRLRRQASGSRNKSDTMTNDRGELHSNMYPKVTDLRQTLRFRKKTIPDSQRSDSEITLIRRTRFRGQASGSRKKCDIMTNERGKLHSNMFFQYFSHIWSTFPEEKMKSVEYLDPVWFFMYANKNSKVIDWIKEKDIFSKKYVLVPIVIWSHWSLLIFCNLGKELCSKTDGPCMLLLDSLQEAGLARPLEPIIRRLLSDMYTSMGRPETKQQLKKVPLKIPKVPQQSGADNCGFYVLHYINLFLESAPENFNICEGYPYFMKEDWFTDEQVEAFCKRLDDVPITSDHPELSDCDSQESGFIEHLGSKPGK